MDTVWTFGESFDSVILEFYIFRIYLGDVKLVLILYLLSFVFTTPSVILAMQMTFDPLAIDALRWYYLFKCPIKIDPAALFS